MFSNLKAQNYLFTGFFKIWQFGNLISRNLIKIFIKQGQNNIFFLLITLSSSLTFAQNPSTQIEIDFSQIQEVSASKETFTLELRDSRVDTSHIAERFRSLMSQSDYQNLSFTDSYSFISNIFREQIENLCSNLVWIEEENECQMSSQDQLFGSLREILRPQRFLYPNNYYPIGSLPSEIIQKANSTSCCYDHDIAKNTALRIFSTIQSDGK